MGGRNPPAAYLHLPDGHRLSSALWAGGIGLGAYYVGPPVLDFVGDLGLVTGVVLIVVVVAMAIGEVLRRRRRAAAGTEAELEP